MHTVQYFQSWAKELLFEPLAIGQKLTRGAVANVKIGARRRVVHGKFRLNLQQIRNRNQHLKKYCHKHVTILHRLRPKHCITCHKNFVTYHIAAQYCVETLYFDSEGGIFFVLQRVTESRNTLSRCRDVKNLSPAQL